MSTICKIAVAVPREVIRESVAAFLAQRGMAFEIKQSEWPLANEREYFAADEEFPSVFSFSQVTPDVSELHFNSFCTVQDLASYISSSAQARVVVNIYQSTSTASYWALHENGKLIRSIEAGDGEVRSLVGSRLPFEPPEPGILIGGPGEEFRFFDSDSQDWYNREVGVHVEVYQQYDPGWTNLLRSKPETVSRRPTQTRKRWWQFW